MKVNNALFLFQLAKCELGNRRFVSINMFKGRMYFHVTEFSEHGKPTKVVVALAPGRASTLFSFIEDIQGKVGQMRKGDNVFDYRRHLGGGVYCSVKSGCYAINLRLYFLPERH